jgi:hypothetical protein
MRHIRQRLARSADLLERPAVVEWREHRELLDRSLDLDVDERRSDEPAAAVDDPMPDCARRDEARHLPGLAPRDEVKLEAGGAGVDDQDVDRRGFS